MTVRIRPTVARAVNQPREQAPAAKPATSQAKDSARLRALSDVSTFEPAKKVAAEKKIAAPAQAPAAAKTEKTEKKGFFAKLASFATGIFGSIRNVASTIATRVGSSAASLANGIANSVTGIAKNLAEAARTFGSGIGQIFKGEFKEGFKNLGMGLVKVVQTPIDAIFAAGGGAVSAIQTLIGIEPVGRKLSAAEIADMRKIFGDSIDYSKVVIKEGNAGLFTIPGHTFVHLNTIYVAKGSLPLRPRTLVHEMVHVWQHQNGGTDYMSEALAAQHLGDGYDWQKALGEAKTWEQCNPEQQAMIIEIAWRAGMFNDPDAPFLAHGVDYTEFVQGCIEKLREGNGAP